MGTLAVANVEIVAQMAGFKSSVDSQIKGAVGSGISVPAKVDGAGLESQAKTVFSDLGSKAGGFFSSTFGQTLKSVGLLSGAAGIFELFKAGVEGAVSLQTQQRQTNTVFGQSADVVSAFADTSVTKLGQSKEAALQLTNQFGLMFTGFGVGQAQAAADSTALVQTIANISSATGASTADVSSAVDSALRGRATALKDYGIVVDSTTLQQKALADGLIKPVTDQNAIAIAAAHVDTLRKNLTGAAAPTNALANAQLALTVAQRSQAAVLEQYPASSDKALAAQLRVQTAQQAIAKLEQSSALDPTQKAAAQAQLNDAVDAYNKLLDGSLPKLTAAQTATETLSIIQSQTALDTPFGSTTADKFAQFTAAIDNAKTSLGEGLLPVMTSFADWIAQHTGDIEHVATVIGTDLGDAFTVIGNVGKWFVDHPEFAAAIAAAFAVSKIRDWKNEVTGIPGLVNSILGKLNVPGFGGGAPTTAPAQIAATTEFQAAVTEFGLAVTRFSVAAGVGAVEGAAVPVAEGAVAGAEGAAAATTAAATATSALGVVAAIGGGVVLGDIVSQMIGGPSIGQAFDALRQRVTNDGTVNGQGTPQSLALWARSQVGGSHIPGFGPDVQKSLQDALGSAPILKAATSGDAQGLSDIAQVAAENHWAKQAQEYGDLSKLVQSGQITTEAQVQAFLQSGATYAGYLATSLKVGTTLLQNKLDPALAGAPGGTTLSDKQVGADVVSAYNLNLGRDPEQAGTDFWTGFIRQNGVAAFNKAFMAAASDPVTGEMAAPLDAATAGNLFDRLKTDLTGPSALGRLQDVSTAILNLPVAQQGPFETAFASALHNAGLDQLAGALRADVLGVPYVPTSRAGTLTSTGSVTQGGITRSAGGGWFDTPTVTTVGDATGGGEAVLNTPQILALLQRAVAMAGGSSGPAVVNVYQPTSDVDVLLALQRNDYHQQVAQNRGVLPAAQWPANMPLRPGGPS